MKNLSIKRFSEISLRINSMQDLHELLVLIMDTAKELLHTEGASLLLYDRIEDNLIFDIVRGPKGNLLANQRIPIGQGIAGIVAREKKPLIVNDAENDPRIMRVFDLQSNFRTANLIAVPMMREQHLIGVLEVVNSLGRDSFSQEDLELLSFLSAQAAIAIFNRQLYQELQERMDELRCIYEISQSISSHFDFHQNVDNILFAIRRTLNVRKISFLLEQKQKLQVISSIGLQPNLDHFSISDAQSVSAYVFRSGDPLLVQNIDKELKQYHFQSNGHYQTKSFVSVPIIVANKPIGVLNVADKEDESMFDFFELKVLSTVAAEIGKAYELYLNHLNRISMQQLKKDLETAAMIQKNSLMQLPQNYHGLSIASHYEACEAVGGDFYDMITLGDNRVTFVIGDVSGKGVTAALFMEHVKTLLQSFIPRYKNPRTSISELNKKILSEKRMSLFVTVMIVQIEADSQQMRYASAGHNHQLILRKKQNQVQFISGKGAPAGTFLVDNYQEFIVNYEKGDILFLYTDGITEAINDKYEEFGEERLMHVMENLCTKDEINPDILIQKVLGEVSLFCGNMSLQDDLTILAVQF